MFVLALGDNLLGALGARDAGARAALVAVRDAEDATTLLAGASSSGVLAGDRVALWGLSAHGELDADGAEGAAAPVALAALGGHSLAVVDAADPCRVRVRGLLAACALAPARVAALAVGLRVAFVLTADGRALELAGGALQMIAGLERRSVTQIAAGDAHGAAVDARGCAFVWGCNVYAQCAAAEGGAAGAPSLAAAARVSAFDGLPRAGGGAADAARGVVSRVAAGGAATAFLLESGDAYAPRSRGARAALVEGLPPAADLCGDGAAWLAVARDGTVWAWGGGDEDGDFGGAIGAPAAGSRAPPPPAALVGEGFGAAPRGADAPRRIDVAAMAAQCGAPGGGAALRATAIAAAGGVALVLLAGGKRPRAGS